MASSSRGARRRQPVRSLQRRPAVTRAIEPPDYSRDYAYVQQDLIRIAIIGGILLALMVGASFVL
ncbi:MAG: hypothetical protein RMK84_00120 [Oscillochloridaceae bacterium]|nr:hypothetical protein [Chloroflexaceae bacterium]MDW8388501.1 hypothetical protein [Oscillochloridaceae bacterium]